MGLISETRSSLENPQTPLSYPAEWLLDIFNGGRTDSGIRVSEMTALQVSAIWACCEIKGGAIGALEIKIYQKIVRADGRLKRQIDHEHAYWNLLNRQPNKEMSAFTFRKTSQIHRMLWGNCYAEMQRDGAGRIIALWPRNPARIRPKRVVARINFQTSDGIAVTMHPGDYVYVTTEGMETESINPESPTVDPLGRNERYILPEDILHIPGMALDGRLGQSVIQMARNAVGLALATEKFGGKFFGNGALGYGIFKLPGSMSPEDLLALRKEIQEAWGGENANRPMVLDAGMDYTSTSAKPNEGQFIETRNFQISEACRAMGVPPHMVGVTEKTSRANTEQVGQEFVCFSLRPDTTAWEHEVNRKMLPPPERGRNAAKIFDCFFDTRPLTMPAATDQRAFIQAMIQWGVMEPNDAREWLQMNPLEGKAADTTWMQINMAPVDQLFETPALPSADGDGEENDGEEENQPSQKPGKKDKPPKESKSQKLLISRMMLAYSRLFRDAFGRVCGRSNVDDASFRRIFLPVLITVAEELERNAAALFHAEPSPDALESSKFLGGYLGTMFHRFTAESWSTANGKTSEICERELSRAIRALAVEMYRNAATRVAKQQTEEIEVNS